MDILTEKELSDMAVEVLKLSDNMSKAFNGPEYWYLKLAIMAGLADAYNQGIRNNGKLLS